MVCPCIWLLWLFKNTVRLTAWNIAPIALFLRKQILFFSVLYCKIVQAKPSLIEISWEHSFTYHTKYYQQFSKIRFQAGLTHDYSLIEAMCLGLFCWNVNFHTSLKSSLSSDQLSTPVEEKFSHRMMFPPPCLTAGIIHWGC